MEKRPKILIVDDELSQRTLLGDLLRDAGYPVELASSGSEALSILDRGEDSTRLVITDLSMPGMTGVELLRKARANRPEVDFVVATAHATLESAIDALRGGASDYLLKPLELDDVLFRVRRIFSLRQTEAKVDRLEQENRELRRADPPVAESPAMKALLKELAQVARTGASVLLMGETGVGKEVLARYVHESSPRAKEAFVAVNCSAIPENLVESEFFGYEKGAFTGAEKRTTGFFERADGGTLFLDEIGELDLKLQPKILRAIEERKIRRVAGSVDIETDVRFVAATNRDLKAMVAARTFRDDLYYRLNVVQLRIPPLRERKEDIPALVRHLVKRYSAALKVKIHEVDPSYIAALQGYGFPGNVRELANIVERSMIYQTGGRLTAANLPSDLGGTGAVPSASAEALPESGSLAELLGAYEKRVIEGALAACGSDADKAAVRLDVARSTLYSKMAKHGIK